MVTIPATAIRVLAVYGTRPEAVKMAPLVLAMRAHAGIDVEVVVTGQHREMLDQINTTFGIQPAADLDIHQPGQSLTDVTCRSLVGLESVIRQRRPDLLLVQGDTTSTFAASLAAFYAQVPVAHAEAGLRTADRYSPFPEEINRRLTTQLASLHLAPTEGSRLNLLTDGVDPGAIVVTGNSVIDALLWTVGQPVGFSDPELADRVAGPRPILLVTAHRRESWGEPMRAIGRALASLALRHPHYDIVFPAHRNPLVREAILPAVEGLDNVLVTEPLNYEQFAHLMNRSRLILSDSGGVQEEGPSLGKPVLVMRDNTERPEAVEAGAAKLVGTDELRIVQEVSRLIEDEEEYARMAHAVNPYGDGHAGLRTAEAVLHMFGRGPLPQEFTPARGLDGTKAGAVHLVAP